MDFGEFADKSIGPVYEVLLRVAKERRIITYRELAHEADVPDAGKPYIWFSHLPGVLDEINRFEYKDGRPMLSTVVVNKRKGVPGLGFFALAEELFLLCEGSTDEEKELFHKIELHSVYEEFAPEGSVFEQEDIVKKYCQAMNKVLIDVARERETVTCMDLARKADLPPGLNDTSMQEEFLSLIDTTEWLNDRPLLGAVVVNAENGEPRRAFFASARLIGVLPHDVEAEANKPGLGSCSGSIPLGWSERHRHGA